MIITASGILLPLVLFRKLQQVLSFPLDAGCFALESLGPEASILEPHENVPSFPASNDGLVKVDLSTNLHHARGSVRNLHILVGAIIVLLQVHVLAVQLWLAVRVALSKKSEL